MASKYENYSPIPERDSSEEIDEPTELPNNNIIKSRPGIRSNTYTPESTTSQEECRMRNKTVRAHTDNAFELISEDDDNGIEWEKVNWVMVANQAYTTDEKLTTLVRKDDVIFVSAHSKCGQWYKGLNQSTGVISTIPSNLLQKKTQEDPEVGTNRGAIILDKGPQWESSASTSDCTPSLTSDDTRFFSDMHTGVKPSAILPVIQNPDIPSIPMVCEEFYSVAKHQIFNVAGVDKAMRPVITFSACRLPSASAIDHNILFKYMMHTLDHYVETDYTVVYFHYGLNSTNKPNLRWLWSVYKELDRKYKKNLKKLYIVHPTSFIKLVYTFFKPYISAKFGKKVQYINRMEELEDSLYLYQIDIPQEVRRHNDSLRTRKVSRSLTDITKTGGYSRNGVNTLSNEKDRQFGVPLRILIERHKQQIPFIVEDCVTYIESEGLQSVGIFRRGPGQAIMQEIKSKANRGERIDFREIGDVHVAAVLIKMFIRELPQPLLTEELYEPMKTIHGLEAAEKIERAKELIGTLPLINLDLLKYVLRILRKVIANEETNKMSASNLSIVIGPNILWSSQDSASLTTLNYINAFTYILLTRLEDIFPEESSI